MKSTVTSMNCLGSACDGDGNQSIKIDVEKLVPAPECCIYEVPKPLREINSKAYTPQLISIGPFHHDNKNLAADTQNQKERYRHEFVKKIGKERFDELKNFVKENEKDIHNCYADRASQSSSTHEEFIEMILNDAIFIIELFLRNYHIDDHKSDFLLHQRWLTKAIKLDLQLLENQLPYFVLKKLYMLACRSRTGEISPSFLSLACRFFDFDEKSAALCNGGDFVHFLDMRRYAMMGFLSSPKLSGERTKEQTSREEAAKNKDLPSAVSLNESGVIFKNRSSKPSSNGLLDINFKKGRRCIPFFCKNELQIPRIIIEDCTECLIRNVMALEQCHYPGDAHMCNYIDLIDCLINTKEDVDLLVEKEIISNRVGDHKAISKMFNGLCLQIMLSESCYQGIRNDLKKFHDKWWNRTKATLVSVYFRDVWRGGNLCCHDSLTAHSFTNHAEIVGRLDSTWKIISFVI